VTPRISFVCERFEHVPDGSSIVWGVVGNGPSIARDDVFDSAMGPGRFERPVLKVTSISAEPRGDVAELRQGQRGRLVLSGDAPPDVEGGWVLVGFSYAGW
jgi:hypothetical protein